MLKNEAENLIDKNEITIPFIDFSNMLTTALIIIKQCQPEKEHSY